MTILSNLSKFFVGIDPGITTGYAIVDDQGTLLESGNLLHEDLKESMMCSVVGLLGVSVIIEDTPIPTRSQMNRELQEIISDLHQVFPAATTIPSGVWKQAEISKRYPFPTKRFPHPTQHQRDAYHLVMFFINSQKIKEAHE